MKFTSSFCSSSINNVLFVCDIVDSIKLGKRSRNDHDKLGFPGAKSCRDVSTESKGQSDFSKAKCYNCGQIGYIKA